MTARNCQRCGSNETSLVIQLCLDWPSMKRASIDCSETCETCATRTSLDAMVVQLSSTLAPDIAELNRYLATGNMAAADRCTTRLLRSIARQIPRLEPQQV